jgi:hypothetical protein
VINARAGKLPPGKQLLADLDEAVAEARLLDEHGHGHQGGERATGTPQRLVYHREHPTRLRLEVAGDVLAVRVDRRELARQPHDASAVGDDRGRVRARFLGVGSLQVFGHRRLLVEARILLAWRADEVD